MRSKTSIVSSFSFFPLLLFLSYGSRRWFLRLLYFCAPEFRGPPGEALAPLCRGEPFATPLLRIKFAAPTLPRRGISAFHFSLFSLLFSLKRTPRKIQGVRFSCHSIQTVVSTGSPWTYLWSQSSSKSRERRSIGHPRARSSARTRNSGAGSRHSR